MEDSAYQAKLATATAIGNEESRRQHLRDWTRAAVLVHVGGTFADVEDSTAVIAAAELQWPALHGQGATSMDQLAALRDEPAWPWQRGHALPLRVAGPPVRSSLTEPWLAAVLAAAAQHAPESRNNWLVATQATQRRQAIALATTFAEFEAAVAWANRCDSIERTWLAIACHVGFAGITAALDTLTRRGHITPSHVAQAEALVRAKVGLSSRQLAKVPAFRDLLEIAFQSADSVAGFQLAALSRVVAGMDASAGQSYPQPILERCLDVIDAAAGSARPELPETNRWRIWGQPAVVEDMTTQFSGALRPPLPVVD